MIREGRSRLSYSRNLDKELATYPRKLRLGREHRFFGLIFVALHFPLGLAMHFVPALGTVQAGLVVLIGLRAASRGIKGEVVAISVLGYLMGAEALWRLLSLSPLPPYEGGKYATLVIASVGIMRRYRDVREWPALPLLYLLCLLPSTIMLLGRVDLGFARQSVIYHLAGPLALGLCSIYLSGIKLSSGEIRQFAIWTLAPILSISALVLYNTIAAEAAGTLRFGMSSNMITSAEFGPNQISNTLALGALICWLWLITLQTNVLELIMLLGIMLGLTTQLLLTFSRGGAYVLGLSVISTLVVLTFTREKSIQFTKGIFRLAIILLAFTIIIWPWAEGFTDGALTKRYTVEDTNRLRIITTELEIWRDYPIFGIGPGRSNEFIRLYAPITNKTHTEFTRLLAEHGLFGLFAIVILVLGGAYNYLKSINTQARMWKVGCFTYVFLYMTQAATRTVAPPVMYALIWTYSFSDLE